MNTRKNPPRIAVLVETSTSWGRALVTGIHDFTRTRRPWQVCIEARGAHEHLRVPAGWTGDGVIARVANPRMIGELRALNLPIVNVSSIDLPDCPFPRVQHDTGAGAEMAARYLQDRGFRHFAYFTLMNLPYVAAQQESFRRSVETVRGGSYSVYGVRSQHGAEPDWNLDAGNLIRWLMNLPRPVGMLTWNAGCGRQIIYACQQCGLRIPDDVALISGTDDDLLCELVQIPISAVHVASRHIGQRAAAAMDQILRGSAQPMAELVPPLRVISRRSTDIIPLADPAVRAALRFIQEHQGQPMQVNEVACHAGISRRLLERRFMEMLARTPASEIRRSHRERAAQLLRETDQSVAEVARQAGFSSADYLAQVFQADLGLTPSRYRKRFRLP